MSCLDEAVDYRKNGERLAISYDPDYPQITQMNYGICVICG